VFENLVVFVFEFHHEGTKGHLRRRPQRGRDTPILLGWLGVGRGEGGRRGRVRTATGCSREGGFNLLADIIFDAGALFFAGGALFLGSALFVGGDLLFVVCALPSLFVVVSITSFFLPSHPSSTIS